MLKEVKGLVIRTVDVKESDRLITVYTEECGIITALAKGSRSVKSRKLSATGLFCYSDFILYGQGDKLWVHEAELIESFFELRENVEGMALAFYIAEVLDSVGTADPETELLRLALNSLFAIAKGKYSLEIIKAAFEIRSAAILGFMPDVISCHSCSRRTGSFFFDIMAGAIECYECHGENANEAAPLTDPHESHIICHLTEGAKTALGYCIYSPLEKLFSFSITGEDLRLFCRAAEEYLLNHLERGFKTLDFYKEVKT